MKNKKCPLCYEAIYSKTGRGCIMCGMPLQDKTKDFCSKICRKKYEKINNEINIMQGGNSR